VSDILHRLSLGCHCGSERCSECESLRIDTKEEIERLQTRIVELEAANSNCRRLLRIAVAKMIQYQVDDTHTNAAFIEVCAAAGGEYKDDEDEVTGGEALSKVVEKLRQLYPNVDRQTHEEAIAEIERLCTAVDEIQTARRRQDEVVAEQYVDVCRLRETCARLSTALERVDVACMEPEDRAMDTEAVGCPVSCYAVDCDDEGVVRRTENTVRELRRQVTLLELKLDTWIKCGDEIMKCVHGTPGPLSDSDVCGEIEALRADVAKLREALQKYADHNHWICGDTHTCTHTCNVHCCRDWWQGADSKDESHGWTVAEKALGLPAKKEGRLARRNIWWDGKQVAFVPMPDGKRFVEVAQRHGDHHHCPLCRRTFEAETTTSVTLIISNQAGVPNQFVHDECLAPLTDAFAFRYIAEDYQEAKKYAHWFPA
jgi:hypothetical protein